MKTFIKLGVAAAVALGLAVTLLGVSFGNQLDGVNRRFEDALAGVNSQVLGINSQIENVVSFLSTTTTSTTTTTTTTTLPPKPVDSRSELVRKVDEIYPGASTKYSKDVIEKAGKFACARWNNAPITRLNVIRDIMEYTKIDDLEFGNAVAEAVVWTICWETTSFPNGPREYR